MSLDSASDDLDAAAAWDSLKKVADRTSCYEWDSIYDSIGRDSVQYHGHEVPQREGLTARGGNEAPGSGNMPPRGSTTAHGSAMDSFAEQYPGLDTRVDNYGITETSAPRRTSASDIATFNSLYR